MTKMSFRTKVEKLDLFSFLKVCMLSLLIVSTCYQGYNMFHAGRLATDIQDSFTRIYSSIRRFGSYYNNAETEVLAKAFTSLAM
nr:hypothetical protein [Enterovibrio nigricans]